MLGCKAWGAREFAALTVNSPSVRTKSLQLAGGPVHTPIRPSAKGELANHLLDFAMVLISYPNIERVLLYRDSHSWQSLLNFQPPPSTSRSSCLPYLHRYRPI